MNMKDRTISLRISTEVYEYLQRNISSGNAKSISQQIQELILKEIIIKGGTK